MLLLCKIDEDDKEEDRDEVEEISEGCGDIAVLESLEINVQLLLAISSEILVSAVSVESIITTKSHVQFKTKFLAST